MLRQDLKGEAMGTSLTGPDSGPPPGWYPHPRDPRRLMFWTGAEWDLSQVRSAVPPMQTQPVLTPPMSAPTNSAFHRAPTDEAFRAAVFDTIDGQRRALVDRARRSGPLRVLFGLLLAIGVSVAGAESAGEGRGVIWVGGYLVAGSLIFNGIRRYMAARKLGLPSPQGWLIAAVGLAAVTAVYTGFQYVTVINNDGWQVGSCVASSGEHVPCSSGNAVAVVTDLVDSPSQCPEGSGELDNGTIACLQAK